MKLLGIDTSTDCASVALLANNEIIATEQTAIKQHALCLLPMIKQLLAQTYMHLNQLDGIVFGQGPGSFTGLRIACSIAKGLAYGADLPLYPVSGLLSIAAQALNNKVPATYLTLAVIDARMNQVYWNYYRGLDPINEEQVSDVGEINIPGDNHLWLAGVNYEPYQANFSQALSQQIRVMRTIYPSATAMIDLVKKGLIAPVDVALAAPKYVRHPIV